MDKYKGGAAILEDHISMRQLLVLLFAALLSPAVQILPGTSAAKAGEAGWLSGLVVLPAFALLCWSVARLLYRMPEGQGLAETLQWLLGPVVGKILIFLYLVWGLMVLSANLRSCGQRFLATSYQNSPLWGVMLILLAAALWICVGKLSAFARAGEIFYLILCGVLAIVLVFASLNLKLDNICPVWVEDIPDVARATVPVFSILGYTILGGFLVGNVRRQEGDCRKVCGWGTAICLLLTVFQVVNIGNFGADLVSRMDVPLYMMAKGVGVRGGFERIESLVVAVWALSDLVLVTVVIFSCCAMAKSVFGLRQAGSAALPIVVLGGLGAFLLFPDGFALRRFGETILRTGNLLFGTGIPVLLCLIGAFRKREEEGGERKEGG